MEEKQQRAEEIAQDLKQGRSKYTMSGTFYTFRTPDLEDLAECDENFPLLPMDEITEEQAEEDPTASLREIIEDPAKTRRFMKRVNLMLQLTCLSHELVNEYPLEPSPDSVPVRSLNSQDRMFAFLCLIGLAGFNKEAAARLVPLSETGNSSLPATALGTGMGNSQAASSIPATQAPGTDSKN